MIYIIPEKNNQLLAYGGSAAKNQYDINRPITAPFQVSPYPFPRRYREVRQYLQSNVKQSELFCLALSSLADTAAFPLRRPCQDHSLARPEQANRGSP